MKWNLRSLVMALRGHMLTQPKEIGSIVTTPDRQRFLAKMSRHYVCRQCGTAHSRLLGDEPMEQPEHMLAADAAGTLVNTKLTSRRLKKRSKSLKDQSMAKKSTGQIAEKSRNAKLSLVFATKGFVLLLLSVFIFYQLHYV